MIFARKIYKIPKFYMIFAREMPEFYVILPEKYFCPNFRGARATYISYAYGVTKYCVDHIFTASTVDTISMMY